MNEECAPYLPISGLLGHSGFDYYLGRVEDEASENIQEIIYLGEILMWNDAAVYGGRMDLKMYVRDWYEMLKALESESDMIFLVTLMCW